MKRHTTHWHFAGQPRKGVALVLSLILIVVVSATAAVALTMVGSERRVVDDQQATAEAHAMARSAYAKFLTDPTGLLASFTPTTFTGPDSVRVDFSEGYAWVSVQRVRPSVTGSATLFLVRSRAVRTSHQRSNTPVAERVFAQYALWQTGAMPTLAAWTSLSGLHKEGASGTISGADNCGLATSVGGVATPASPGYTQNGSPSVPSGSPPLVNMGAQDEANAMVKVDWQGIVSGTSLTPDIVIPGVAWPSFLNADFWPVIYVNQAADFALLGSGRGLLIVRNNLTISGALLWNGVILVGGTLTSSGENVVNGAVVTGLNVLLGETVANSSIGNGEKTYRYDSCMVEKAGLRFKGLAPVRNSSADNWASY